MMKKSLMLFVLVLIMFSFFGNAGFVQGEYNTDCLGKCGVLADSVDINLKDCIDNYCSKEVVGEKEDSDASNQGAIVGSPTTTETTDQTGKKSFRDYWEESKKIAIKPFVWTRDSVIYPVLGIREGGAFVSFFIRSFGAGFFAGLIAFVILNLLVSSEILENSFLSKIFQEEGFVANFVNRKIPYVSLVTGFVYAVLMSIPVLNRFIEIITLQIFAHLLGGAAEFFVRLLSLSIIIIILFFLPGVIRNILDWKKKAKEEEVLRKAALKEAMQDVVLKQSMKDLE